MDAIVCLKQRIREEDENRVHCRQEKKSSSQATHKRLLGTQTDHRVIYLVLKQFSAKISIHFHACPLYISSYRVYE